MVLMTPDLWIKSCLPNWAWRSMTIFWKELLGVRGRRLNHQSKSAVDDVHREFTLWNVFAPLKLNLDSLEPCRLDRFYEITKG